MNLVESRESRLIGLGNEMVYWLVELGNKVVPRLIDFGLFVGIDDYVRVTDCRFCLCGGDQLMDLVTRSC